MAERLSNMMCPHCGAIVDCLPHELVPTHNHPTPTRQVCPGTGQNPRCAESDARLLWNGKPNERFQG